MSHPREKMTPLRLIKIFNHLNSLDLLQRELANDVNRAHLESDTSPSDQYLRRNFIRVFAASVEGVSNALKGVVIELHDVLPTELTIDEKSKLLEVRLKANGEPEMNGDRPKPRFLRFEENFKFAIAMFVRVSGASTSFDYSAEEFRLFQGTIKVRDRLMHPRLITDLVVSDQEKHDAGRARLWYLKSNVPVLVDCVQSMDRRFKEVYPELRE